MRLSVCSELYLAVGMAVVCNACQTASLELRPNAPAGDGFDWNRASFCVKQAVDLSHAKNGVDGAMAKISIK